MNQDEFERMNAIERIVWSLIIGFMVGHVFGWVLILAEEGWGGM